MEKLLILEVVSVLAFKWSIVHVFKREKLMAKDVGPHSTNYVCHVVNDMMDCQLLVPRTAFVAPFCIQKAEIYERVFTSYSFFLRYILVVKFIFITFNFFFFTILNI